MNTILTAILSGFGGFIFAGAVLGVKRVKALTQVIKALSHDALFTRCESLITRGNITTDELENLDMLYDAYQAMGQNGAGTELYNRAKSLPLRSQE